jgi:hypothetical protein
MSYGGGATSYPRRDAGGASASPPHVRSPLLEVSKPRQSVSSLDGGQGIGGMGGHDDDTDVEDCSPSEDVLNSFPARASSSISWLTTTAGSPAVEVHAEFGIAGDGGIGGIGGGIGDDDNERNGDDDDGLAYTSGLRPPSGRGMGAAHRGPARLRKPTRCVIFLRCLSSERATHVDQLVIDCGRAGHHHTGHHHTC